MAWKRKRDPLLPSIPVYHDPERCYACGHHQGEHNAELGCMVEGGTDYIEDDENGNGKRVCSCEQFVPVPEEVLAREAETNAASGGR